PQVLGRRNQFAFVAGSVDVPFAPCAHGQRQRKRPRLPGFMENRLIRLVLNRAHALNAAHIVHAIHAPLPSRGMAPMATPTIESRVTSAASASSVSFSLPAGRSGSTR